MENLHIRKAVKSDTPRLKEVFAAARQFMVETGNPTQWTDGYPSDELLQADIDSGDCYTIANDGEHIVATFVLRPGDDPTYSTIYGGAWLSNRPYATIHRIASSGETKGIFATAMEFAMNRYNSIRIDTHRDNTVMQRAIVKAGFTYCGIIHCWNGSERLAYQKDF